jgi:hypothetical protein
LQLAENNWKNFYEEEKMENLIFVALFTDRVAFKLLENAWNFLAP